MCNFYRAKKAAKTNKAIKRVGSNNDSILCDKKNKATKHFADVSFVLKHPKYLYPNDLKM
ncbi:hypothetical protein VIBNISO65_1350094 [Vibrio nigripulchritudo SO65]|nr:hypothetical protein VIBNIAM115_2030001 [Vibrio nigripulchritudo AM115]CCN44299.1 hypothetical protein VIBNIFTn2_750001 [Vibrio nigripulchritudo FTn2]CCN68035.1 hypothetical protein VIBNIPon4_940001 [Vibrio nigripulchritudo POn4]CCN75452.1 hypothetical protein VIBNISO65_1350094 [Vibrio nigripulchritudo SO65]